MQAVDYVDYVDYVCNMSQSADTYCITATGEIVVQVEVDAC